MPPPLIHSYYRTAAHRLRGTRACFFTVKPEGNRFREFHESASMPSVAPAREVSSCFQQRPDRLPLRGEGGSASAFLRMTVDQYCENLSLGGLRVRLGLRMSEG
jgi:hypothetical protein